MSEKQKFSIRTDLAIEARELIEESRGDIDDGIIVQNEESDGIIITHVEITNENGSRAMGKPVGNFITIEAKGLRDNDSECHEMISHRLKECLEGLITTKKDAVFLVVGLGNWNITPDALGPKVVDKILVTRHMMDSLSETIKEAVSPAAAIAPGVMGITGIETAEIIKGIVEKLKPDVVIAVDALAARKFSRINSTIQLSDTGICPGSGVGNKRTELSKETLGVPVIAIGVPTVVDAATLAHDTMDIVFQEMKSTTDKKSKFYEMIMDMENEDRFQLINEVLTPYAQNMFVTPKEVDAVIDRLSKIIASAINASIHKGLEIEDLGRYSN